jgi:N-acetylmuramoyl-L-alanine amidase
MVYKICHCCVFKPAGIILLAAILLSGCAIMPTTPEEAAAPMPAPGGISTLDWAAPGFTPEPVAPAIKTNASPVGRTNLPMAIMPKPAPKPAPILIWTSLNRWAAEHNLAAPRLLSSTPTTTYAISSDNGVMVVGIGSREATWNGVTVHLGFTPEFIDGQVFVYGADLQKNLEPLLIGGPLDFPGTNRVIVIDPGHGGSEPGAQSVLGDRFEKQFTLDWARRLKPLLETNGWTVFLTRTSDTEVTLSNRVAFAESHHADLFISLHFNSAAPNQKPAGLETYCLTPTGMPSTLTRGYPDIWSQNFPNNNFDAQNLQLAVRLQHTLYHATSLEDRGVNHARFLGVLRGQKRPAILIEGGYLSNPHDAKLIEASEFRQELAAAVASALK